MSNGNEIYSTSIQNTHLHFIIHNESFIQNQNERWKKALHSHVYYEILFSLNDSNKLILGNCEVLLKNNFFAVVRPYQNHSAFFENVTDLVSIGFYYGQTRSTDSRYNLNSTLDQILSANDNIGTCDENLQESLSRLEELCQLDDPISEGLITALLTQLLYKIIAALNVKALKSTVNDSSDTSHKTYLPRGNAFDALCQVNDTLNARYMEDITPDLLSRKYFISPKQINRYIYSLYGQTFLQRRTNLRIIAAQKRLKETNDSIAQISAAVGYNSINTFYSAFKTLCGTTPDKYRHSNISIN